MAYKFEQYQEAIDKQHATRQDFIKNLLTIASAMLAILGAFQSGDPKSDYARSLYLITLFLLSSGILTGGTTLYFETIATKTVSARIKTEILKQFEDANYQPAPIVYNPPILFYVCEKVCYISLMLSVVALGLYSAAA